MTKDVLYREINLGVGVNSDPTEVSALKDRLGPDAMEVLQNLAEIASTLSDLLKTGTGMAVVVREIPGNSEERLVSLVGLEPLDQEEQE